MSQPVKLSDVLVLDARLAEQDFRAESVSRCAANIWQELVAWLAVASLQRFGFTFVETGYMPSEASARTNGCQLPWLGLWFQISGHFFRKLRIQLAPHGDVVCDGCIRKNSLLRACLKNH
jgi:hypothetical protein